MAINGQANGSTEKQEDLTSIFSHLMIYLFFILRHFKLFFPHELELSGESRALRVVDFARNFLFSHRFPSHYLKFHSRVANIVCD